MGKFHHGAQLKLEFLRGLYLGPLLFLVDINDITDGLKSEVRIFADDTSLFVVVS